MRLPCWRRYGRRVSGYHSCTRRSGTWPYILYMSIHKIRRVVGMLRWCGDAPRPQGPGQGHPKTTQDPLRPAKSHPRATQDHVGRPKSRKEGPRGRQEDSKRAGGARRVKNVVQSTIFVFSTGMPVHHFGPPAVSSSHISPLPRNEKSQSA